MKNISRTTEVTADRKSPVFVGANQSATVALLISQTDTAKARERAREI